VCAGLAAYFDVDPMIVRAIFILLTMLTGGGFILVYVALMFLVPYANTAEDRAAASGVPFNAQEVVNRAKESYARLADEHIRHANLYGNKADWHKNKAEWNRMRHEMRNKARNMKREFRGRPPFHQGYSPAFGVFSAILSVLWIVALISLIKTGAIFGLAITSYIPLWAAIVLLFIVYHAVTGPMRGGSHWGQNSQGQPTYQYHYDGWHGFADGIGVLFLVICAGFAYLHYPEVREFINQLPQHIAQFWNSLWH
jgi:phage shock protein PspC (stress-responsive transcriptional regulator)